MLRRGLALYLGSNLTGKRGQRWAGSRNLSPGELWEAARAPPPHALSSPRCAALCCPLPSRNRPCNPGRHCHRTARLQICNSRSLRAGRLPPLDWLHPSAEAPPISPGPLITRLLALPGPGSQRRAFLLRLQRREVRYGWVGWAAECLHGSTPRGAGIPRFPSPPRSPPATRASQHRGNYVPPAVAGRHPRSGLTVWACPLDCGALCM